jgi:hypothetical protein
LADKAVIPVCFGGLTKGTMPKPYSGIQGLDLPDDAYYLLRSVRHHLAPETMSPPPTLPTEDYECQEILAALENRPRVFRPIPVPPALPVEAAPASNQMQRTRPAQATEPRR